MRNMTEINRRVIENYRSGADMGGMPRGRMLLLTTTGRRTGTAHTAPMMFVRAQGTIVVVASNSGAPRDPDWYRNLVANPRVTVEVGDERFEATAHPVSAERRDEVWRAVTAEIPMYLQHQASTERPIPLVELVPSGPTK